MFPFVPPLSLSSFICVQFSLVRGGAGLKGLPLIRGIVRYAPLAAITGLFSVLFRLLHSRSALHRAVTSSLF